MGGAALLFSRILERMPKGVSIYLLLLWSYGRSFVFFCCFVGILLSFPIQNVTSDYSAARGFFFRVISVAYPRSAEPRISVILVSDASLQAGLAYPLPYSFHAKIIERLIETGPRVFFIDMTFPDEREDSGLAAMTDSLRRLSEVGTKIYIGVSESRAGTQKPLRRALADLVAEGVLTPVSLSIDQKSGADLYPLGPNADGTRRFAVVAYNDLCAAGWLRDCRSVYSTEDLDVWWGAPPVSLMCDRYDVSDECERITPNWFWRGARLAYKFFATLLGGREKLIDEADPISVPFHPTVDAYAFAKGSVEARMRQAFSQSVVLYGGDFANINDRISSEVYGSRLSGVVERKVPGVFFHAMALDNLITLNGRFIEAGGKRRSILSTVYPLSAAFLFLVLVRALIVYPTNVSCMKRRLNLLDIIIIMIILGAYGIIVFIYWLQPPTDILALIMAPLTWVSFVSSASWLFLSGWVRRRFHKPSA